MSSGLTCYFIAYTKKSAAESTDDLIDRRASFVLHLHTPYHLYFCIFIIRVRPSLRLKEKESCNASMHVLSPACFPPPKMWNDSQARSRGKIVLSKYHQVYLTPPPPRCLWAPSLSPLSLHLAGSGPPLSPPPPSSLPFCINTYTGRLSQLATTQTPILHRTFFASRFLIYS